MKTCPSSPRTKTCSWGPLSPGTLAEARPFGCAQGRLWAPQPTPAEPRWGAGLFAVYLLHSGCGVLNDRMNFQLQNIPPFGRVLGKSLRAARFNQVPAKF